MVEGNGAYKKGWFEKKNWLKSLPVTYNIKVSATPAHLANTTQCIDSYVTDMDK